MATRDTARKMIPKSVPRLFKNARSPFVICASSRLPTFISWSSGGIMQIKLLAFYIMISNKTKQQMTSETREKLFKVSINSSDYILAAIWLEFCTLIHMHMTLTYWNLEFALEESNLKITFAMKLNWIIQGYNTHIISERIFLISRVIIVQVF